MKTPILHYKNNLLPRRLNFTMAIEYIFCISSFQVIFTHVFLQADYVISAMPLSLLNRITFVPPLPPGKRQLTQRAPMGSIIKTVVFYEKAFWKENGQTL